MNTSLKPDFQHLDITGLEMQRLASWSGVIAESPVAHQRIERDWPEHSALSEGFGLNSEPQKRVFTGLNIQI